MYNGRTASRLRGASALVLCVVLASCARVSSSPSVSILPASPKLPQGPLARLEQSLVFAPAKFPAGDWTLPPDLGAEDVVFPSSDGISLHGWYCPHPKPQGVVLYCHGNGGNVTSCVEVLRRLRDMGVSTLAFDYRGYGKSGGTPDESGILAGARAARRWLATRAGVAEQDLIVMGRSLGGAVAVDLAASDGARGLVLESTFTSLPSVAAAHTNRPVSWLMRCRLNSLEKIGKYRGPLLLSHGDADELIPFDHGEQLLAAAPGAKRMIVIPRGRHNDPQTDEYYEALAEFLAQLAKQD